MQRKFKYFLFSFSFLKEFEIVSMHMHVSDIASVLTTVLQRQNYIEQHKFEKINYRSGKYQDFHQFIPLVGTIVRRLSLDVR